MKDEEGKEAEYSMAWMETGGILVRAWRELALSVSFSWQSRR